MVSYQYSYLIGDLVLLAIWLFMFWWRRDARREMIWISVIFGIGGVISEIIFITDWWQPLTITGTRIGIEDFLYGFTVGGIAAVCYEEIFKKKIRFRKANRNRKKSFIITPLIIMGVIFVGLYFLGVHSFYASIIAYLIATAYMLFRRSDLIYDSIASGMILLFSHLVAYWVPELITPGVIANSWFLEKLSGIVILKIPLEDLIWLFFTGAFIGPLYEYWQEGRVVNLRNVKRLKR